MPDRKANDLTQQQAVILCGGMGTRIRDVSEDIPKPMIPIGDRPILWHIMKGFARHGVRRFVLCLGYKSWVIKQYFLNYCQATGDVRLQLKTGELELFFPHSTAEDWEVTLVETGLQTMTGGRLRRVAPYLDGDNFFLTYGDGVGDVDLQALWDFHCRHGRVGTVTAVRSPGRFGEVEMNGHLVREFNEKPLEARGRINGGFFVFHRAFLDLLSDDPNLILEREPLTRLAHQGELSGYTHDGFWQCMDTSRDYQYLNQLWADRNAPWLPEHSLKICRAA